MKLSVIIAAHNEEAHLAAQLQAIGSQSFDGEWDVIVVNNRSTDATADIVTGFAATWPRLRLVNANDMSDKTYAWNVALSQTDADAVAFVDADDVVAPGWLAAAAAALSDADIITGPLDIKTLNPAELVASRGFSVEAPVGSFEGLFPTVRGCNFAMSRSALERLTPFPEGTYPLDDMDLSLRAHRQGLAIVGCPEMRVQYRYRTDLGDLWRQGIAYGRARCRLVRQLVDAGEPRPARLAGWKSWINLVLRSWSVVLPKRRASWVWSAANRVGQLRGSIDHRVVYL